MVAKRSEKTTLLFQTQPHHAHRHNKPEDLKLCVNLRSVGNSALPCVFHVRLRTNKIPKMKLQPLASTTKLTGLSGNLQGRIYRTSRAPARTHAFRNACASEFSASLGDLRQQAQPLHKAPQKHRNIAECCESLTSSMPLLHSFAKGGELKQSARKTANSLQHFCQSPECKKSAPQQPPPNKSQD